MTYEIRVALTGDEAEADSPEAALLAAHTLVDDAFDAMPVQGRVRSARRTITILRNGEADVELTRLAQRGRVTLDEDSRPDLLSLTVPSFPPTDVPIGAGTLDRRIDRW